MKCSLCGSEAHLFLDLGKQPLANKYPTQEEFETEDFFPLHVYFCPNCKNVQLGEMVSRERMFGDYYYLSSVNHALVRHFETFAESLKNAAFVVDIGSNDGILLRPLKARGVKALGVEPSVNVSKIANDAGLPTITSFFNAESAEKIKKEYGKADVIVASSVFTHLEDPHTFIEDIKRLLAEDGVFIIEVEYIGTILKDIQFERFYLDRIFYYSLSSLKHLFESHNMHVANVEYVEPHGGSLRVTFKTGAGERVRAVQKYLEEEENILTDDTLQTFKEKVDEYVFAFRTKLETYKKEGVHVAGYSAPARVSTICNYGNIGPELIAYIVDDSPLKQNRFSPGTHIPIVPKTHLDSMQKKPNLLVVFAYEYIDDIKKKTAGGGFRYLIPIPPREVV